MATLGLSKVFILDKYFTELQKFWETEKKLQGVCSVSMIHKKSINSNGFYQLLKKRNNLFRLFLGGCMFNFVFIWCSVCGRSMFLFGVLPVYQAL